MLYRKGYRSRDWHFCQNCAGWPRDDYEERTIEPDKDLLCTECTRSLTGLKCEVVPEQGIS
jgi:hypothetical protein